MHCTQSHAAAPQCVALLAMAAPPLVYVCRTHWLCMSVVLGYSSMSTMLTLRQSCISDAASGSIHVVTKLAMFSLQQPAAAAAAAAQTL
jgi:hypothetical protein